MLAGLPATIHLSGDEHVSGTIDSGDTHRLTLVLPVAPQRPWQLRSAIVEYASPLGVHRVQGRAHSDPVRPEIVYLARDGGEVVQRREWARVDAVLPVRITADGGVGQAHTRNLSAGGMLVLDPVGLAVGDLVGFALRLADSELPITGRGTVTAVRGAERTAAIRFDAVLSADRERIVRWVMERQRQELRVRSGQ